MTTPKVGKTPQDIVNESGYPLQIYLENQITDTRKQHHWRVLVHEHRWVNPRTEEENFVDLILEHDRYLGRLVIECKRIVGSWTFLLPNIDLYPTHYARVLVSRFEEAAPSFTWDQIDIEPGSYQSAFCVMETDGKRDSRTLESLSGLLLLSLENIALEERDLRVKSSLDWRLRYYFPLVVTTARLQTCVFLPGDVDIEDGKISKSAFEDIQMIRFRKNLAMNLRYAKPILGNLNAVNQENERTVLVIQAKYLVGFLTQLGA